MQGTWILPSLNRSQELSRFFKAYIETESSTPVLILVDKNDPEKEKYLQLEYPRLCTLVLTDAVTMGDKVREVWDTIIDYDWVGILNDDHRPRTPKWDQRILSQINGTNIVGTNDGWVAPARLCGAICFSGGFLRALGYMFLPGQHHLFSDDLWAHLVNRAQCAQMLMDVLVEHEHAYKDPTKRDKTFTLINGEKGLVNGQGEGGFWPGDKKIFEEWLARGAEKDCQKILSIQPKTGIMLATLSHDGNCAMAYALGLTDAATYLQSHNVYFEMARVVGSSLIPHARNSLVDMFLKSKCQRLLMVDSDQGFDRNVLQHLLASPRKIVAGITPHKRFPINLNFEPLEEDKKYFASLTNKGFEEFKIFAKERADAKGDIEVNRAGTGIMMIDRSTFDIMKDHVKDYEPFDDVGKQDHRHKEFFQMGGFGGRFRGEDWFFTENAKKLKIPIYINANAIVSHHGSYTFAV